MCAPAAVGVNDNLAAGETGVTVRATDHEATAGVQVEDGLVVQVLGRHHGLDDVLHQVLVDLVVGDILVVLGGDEDGVHAHGDHGATLLLVLHGHLGLPVGAQPRHAAVLAHLGQLEPELGGQHVGEGHELLGLVGGIAKHVALVTCTDLLQGLRAHAVHALPDVGGLRFNVHQHLAVVRIESNLSGGETNVTARLAHNGFVVDHGLSSDLTKHHHHVGLRSRLARHLGVGILLQACVQDGIRHLITDLVGVPLVHRLRGEQESL
mmetsp:Transcript_718/g.2130  ORF Transcript_718/g.2130 Transcript_718/m.2130 type:complete len:265 (+) Transcript_718:788-1582(+)